MKVSVIIPTYKPGPYIWQCLDSLAKQTLHHSDYELVIVVNGCNEPYYSQIAQHIAQWDPSVCVQLLQTDQGGVSNARNIGIEKSRGRFLCFVDDDDWVSPTYLEGLYAEALTEHTIVMANVRNYNEETQELQDDWLSACYKKNSQLQKPTLLSCRSYMSVACCKMLPRTTIATHRFDIRFRQGEDSLFFAELSRHLKEYRFACPDAIYYRRIRALSAGRARSTRSIIADNARLALAFITTYLKAPLQYDFVFFASRVAACIKGSVHTIRQKQKANHHFR